MSRTSRAELRRHRIARAAFEKRHGPAIGTDTAGRLYTLCTDDFDNRPRNARRTRNAVLRMVRAYGLDPATLTWSEARALWTGGIRAYRIECRNTKLGTADRLENPWNRPPAPTPDA